MFYLVQTLSSTLARKFSIKFQEVRSNKSVLSCLLWRIVEGRDNKNKLKEIKSKTLS